jgi:Protein of unknown function (DUF2891)
VKSKERARTVSLQPTTSAALSLPSGCFEWLVANPLVANRCLTTSCHTLNSDADAAPTRLTPAFYGRHDWHSSVHGHWLLVRLVRTFPDAPFVSAAREALRQSLTAENITQEAAYLRGEGRASFERPYGLAWLLQLVAELREWDDPQARWRVICIRLRQSFWNG